MLEQYCPELKILSLPLRNKFRGITTREVAIFRGAQGWSEFSPFLEYGDEESATWLQASLEAANEPWPTLLRKRIPINATVPVVAPQQVREILERFPGSTTVKVKIDGFEDGAQVLDEILEINPDMRIRLDVNGGWSVPVASANLRAYHQRFGEVFDYVEQPVASLKELAELKPQIPIRIAADESIRKHLDADFQSFSQYADIAILKWQPLGGFAAAQKIAAEINLPVVISSALETGIGISHGLALAASFPKNSLACGLGTVALFEADICSPSSLVEDGYLEVKRREPGSYERYLAPIERADFWRQRILRTLSVLERREN